MDIEWMLTPDQLKNILPKIKKSLKWMDRLHKAPTYDFKVKLEYHSSFGEWWMMITGSGCGSTYTIKKNQRRWKLI